MDHAHTRSSPRSRRRHRRYAAGAVAAVAAVTGAGVAYAGVPGPDGVIHGCYRASTGQLRVVDSTRPTCANGERALDWNQSGPQGTQGPQGAKGETGPTGAIGATGSQGPAGDGMVGSGGWITMSPPWPEPGKVKLLSRDGVDVWAHCRDGDTLVAITLVFDAPGWRGVDDNGGVAVGEKLLDQAGSREVVLRGPAGQGLVLRVAADAVIDSTGQFLGQCAAYATSHH